MMKSNPFEVLRLTAGASEEEIVRQGARLAQQAPDEPTRDAIREAVRALTDDEATRSVHAFLTPPGPVGDAELDRFIAAHRRTPSIEGPMTIAPADEAELRELLRLTLAAELPTTPPTFSRVPHGESVEEIERQTSEALWQSFVVDSCLRSGDHK